MRRSVVATWSPRRSLCLGASLLVAFVVLTLATQPGGSPFLDSHISSLAHHLAAGQRYRLFSPIEPFGSPTASVALTAVVGVGVARAKGVVAGLAVIAAMGVMTAVEGLLRIRVGAIPWSDLAHFLTQPRGHHLVHSTYPSGHTARLGLLSGIALGCLVPARWRLAGVLGVGLITAWIAIQRVAANQHTGTDAVGGALLGWGVAFVYAWLIATPALQRRWWLPRRRAAAADS